MEVGGRGGDAVSVEVAVGLLLVVVVGEGRAATVKRVDASE